MGTGVSREANRKQSEDSPARAFQIPSLRLGAMGKAVFEGLGPRALGDIDGSDDRPRRRSPPSGAAAVVVRRPRYRSETAMRSCYPVTRTSRGGDGCDHARASRAGVDRRSIALGDTLPMSIPELIGPLLEPLQTLVLA